PHVEKSASGNDGEFVTFTIEADVPAVIKDMGNFLITDLAAFWSYPNDAGYLYIENSPQDMVITATTESGLTVTFTPYKAGGPVENTYILVAPVEGNQMHSFVIYFNTADADEASSKWILDENSKLTVAYKIPFDAKTGTEWEGELTGEDTLEDVLLDEHKLSNEVYFNYTNITQDVASTTYEYSPKITKKSSVHEDGNIDYTVLFNNTVPGSGGNEGYINGSVQNLWFNDTFDERLDYVDDSLIVTTYSPWNKDLWVCKYQYTGTVTGNTIRANAADFKLLDYNEEADAHGWNWILSATNFKDYYSWVGSGGRHEYTYKLKVKDEYLYTTDYARLHFDNTAELTWDNDGSSGPVTETTEFYTGLLHKHVVQNDERLDFEVHINRMALDILEGAGTLTVYDKMTPNLSVYWDSIKLKYEDGVGTDVWVDFDSPESRYTYTVTYDPSANSLTFIVPDSLHIIIDYTTLITESGLVSVENSVMVDGKAEVADVIDAFFHVQEHSGGASGSNHKTTLLKQDGLTNIPLPGATFLLYGPMGDPDAVLPSGVSPTIITEDGTVLRFIGKYTTGADGTSVIETQYLTIGGPYALVEYIAPEGYELLTSPVYFYFYDPDPDGVIQTVTTLIAVENFNGSFLIPETGGMGTFNMAIIGIALVAFPVLYSFVRRKRERRSMG
ncbi:MAG: LPXTG cell wall anchor domain-containing protein, partial [Ruminococcaceae bacterium]|nr:LPXTG cell wall anchor domain-containing protein [Oscillospiraceae bacterium]